MSQARISVWLTLSFLGGQFALGQTANPRTKQLQARSSRDVEVSDCLRYKPEFERDQRSADEFTL